MEQQREGRILTICTGNICRSPAAAILLADRLGGEVQVGSAGTGALVDNPVEPAMARLLEGDGVAVEGFAARRLTASIVREADLVLGLTREHRSAAVQLVPTALKRSFTLRELARLAGEIPEGEISEIAGDEAGIADRIRALTVLAPRHRSPVAPEADDVADPYRRGEAAFAAAHEQIREGVDTLVRVLDPRG